MGTNETDSKAKYIVTLDIKILVTNVSLRPGGFGL